MDDLVKEFLAESHENLERLDRAFLTLEQDPTAAEVLSDVFRTIHTIKGTCGFLGYAKLERLSHGGESLLSLVRDGDRSFDARTSQSLFQLVDAVRAMLASIENSGGEGDESYEGLIEQLRALCADEPSPSAPALQAKKQAEHESAAKSSAVGAPHVSAPETSIRVEVQQLDQLMDLVGELVLSRNQIDTHALHSGHSGLRASSQRLAQITSQLQDGVMRARLQPIGHGWSKVPRLVRDLSAQLDKRIRLEVRGAETPIDRGILERLRDPLMHMVRNSIDHGIEAPARRAECGKNAEGTLSIRAWAAGGRVHVAIEDDGAGIDPARMKSKALERGLISAAQAARMGDVEAIDLIFEPGFSTAEALSNVSGRGVGMDVVRTNIEQLGGTVSVTSRSREGTRIELAIPLTLAILNVVMVESAGLCLALPETSVREFARIPPRGEAGGELRVKGARVLPLRGTILPLFELRELLGIAGATDPTQARHAIVLEADGRRFGLVVDELRDIQEIVVKPLGPALQRLGVYSGASILGDGRVALILDVSALAERSGMNSAQAGADAPEIQAPSVSTPRQLLLLEVAGFGQVALDLARVLRLEEIREQAIELAAGHAVLCWRDEVLPVGDLQAMLGGRDRAATVGDAAPTGLLHVVICAAGGGRLALIASRILDVTDESLRTGEGALPPLVCARGILRDAVVDVLDLERLAQTLFASRTQGAAAA